MKTPNVSQMKSAGLDLAARTAGIAVPHAISKMIKKNGIIYSILFTLAGIAISIMGPDKFKVKEMGEGVAIYGIVTTLNELAKPTVNFGLGNATPSSLMGFSLPESVRNILADYVPSLSGTTPVTIYPAGYNFETPRAKLNGIDYNGNPAIKAPSISFAGITVQS